MKEYGFEDIIKKYTGFPSFLSFPAHMEHGWTRLSEPLVSDLKTHRKLMLVYSERRKKAWEKSSNKRCEIIEFPLITYRKSKNILQNKNAKGTLALPSHGSNLISIDYSIDEYCKQLNNLPNEFHPIVVSIHADDISKGVDKLYKKNNIEVSVSPSRDDRKYPEKFYDRLSNFKYTTSNEVGTAAFLSVDLGLPFFILGDIPIEINNGRDPNQPSTIKITDYKYGRIAYHLFNTGPVTTISDEQLYFVNQEMGCEDSINRILLRKILINYYLKYELTNSIIHAMKKSIKYILKI